MVRRGEFLMIRGPSGGGKTTLLNMIGTLDRPTTGTITLLGEAVTDQSNDDFLSDLRLRKIGVNIELPMTLLGTMSQREIRHRAKMLLRMLQPVDGYSPDNTVSGGSAFLPPGQG
eukprot:gene50199-55706_t